MKVERFKLTNGSRTIQVRAHGFTFAAHFDLWTGRYGFPESRGGSVSLNFYKDFPKSRAA